MRTALALLGLGFVLVGFASAQSTDATITGRVLDPLNAAIVGAKVEVMNPETNVHHLAETNEEGIYAVSNLKPGIYRIEVSKPGFKTILKPDVVLHVQDVIAINFTLPVGSVSESITVSGGAPLVNTESAAVSTVVDRQFAENLPMNGRSFQTLIQLTPGVVLTPSNVQDAGQFSVNGQRAASNYWMVDGVSANIGTQPTGSPGNGFAGALGSFGVLGGTNSLVSVDALQEFRIQTSSYAPEFGRTPGGQISILTRSGTNTFHGTAFDYLRNDVLDANNWFANFANLKKPEERQNDFGGTLEGPIVKDRTFFFFSYEGLRLRLPQTKLSTVPDLAARQTAVPTMQPFLNAFPIPNGTDNVATGVAQFNASFSDSSSLDAYSLRVDHRIANKLVIFGRYNHSPSALLQRGAGGSTLSVLTATHITTKTATGGADWFITPRLVNDFRFNYSRVSSDASKLQDTFGDAQPLSALPFPAPYTAQNAFLNFDLLGLSGTFLADGRVVSSLQRQINVIDSLSWQHGPHALKFGVDWRRLSPAYTPRLYGQLVLFLNVTRAKTGTTLFSQITSPQKAAVVFNNIGAFAQDTWRVDPRLTVTYGLRWDVDVAPAAVDGGPQFAAVTGFNLSNLSNLALAPAGTPPFQTTYGNFAPRVGIAYQLSNDTRWGNVVRGGFGIFYDLATSQAGSLVTSNQYPFGASKNVPSGPFPLSSASAAQPQPNPAKGITTFDPHLRLPYSVQWNVAFEQQLGSQQVLTASYVAAIGRRFVLTASAQAPNSNFSLAQFVANQGSADYHALQLQARRRLAHGLQALASYSWSHSIDTGSAGSNQLLSNALDPSAVNANRAASDFDVRHAFSAGITYNIPSPKANVVVNGVLSGWALESVVQARSALPVDVSDAVFFFLDNALVDVRPDVVPGQPLYITGSQCISVFKQVCPGGRGFNPSAFKDPPTDPNTGSPIRQGTLGRNALRGFSAAQWDFAVHRDFPVHESLHLQFRVEMFNILNHPIFAPPNGQFGTGAFGLSSQTLGQSLSTNNVGSGAFSPLYQIGGPRSVQFGLKLVF